MHWETHSNADSIREALIPEAVLRVLAVENPLPHADGWQGCEEDSGGFEKEVVKSVCEEGVFKETLGS